MKKLISILVVVVVVLAIGAFYSTEFINSEPPTPTITVGNTKIATAQGSYCWSGLLESKCVDMVSPPDIVTFAELTPVPVSPEAQLIIEFSNNPKKDTMGANLWLSDEETVNVPINNNVLTAPKEKGVYVYDIYARWEKGSSSYVFVIEVR